MLFCGLVIALMISGFFHMTIGGLVESVVQRNIGEQETVDSINLNQCLGRWYQMYTSRTIEDTWQYDKVCIVADYDVKKIDMESDTVKLGIVVSANYNKPHGERWTADGVVSNTNFRSEPGKCKIKLDGFSSDFYVLALGEVVQSTEDTEKMQYAWSVVSDKIGGMLVIYARDVDTFREKYENHVLQLVKERGFVFPTNKPIETYQSTTECEYRPVPGKD